MSHSMTLELPEELYQSLRSLAEREGKAAEDLGSIWLAATIERLANDPLMKAAGSLDIDVDDLATEHDRYIAEHLMSELLVDEDS